MRLIAALIAAIFFDTGPGIPLQQPLRRTLQQQHRAHHLTVATALQLNGIPYLCKNLVRWSLYNQQHWLMQIDTPASNICCCRK
jgi:hypothetical protein